MGGLAGIPTFRSAKGKFIIKRLKIILNDLGEGFALLWGVGLGWLLAVLACMLRKCLRWACAKLKLMALNSGYHLCIR